MEVFIGVDPGKSGAIVALTPSWREKRHVIRLNDTERTIWYFLERFKDDDYDCFAILEQVSAMPGNGVVSMFKFGQSYGMLRAFLIAAEIPFETVTPAKWQGAMKCRTKGDKNVSKARAQELFPQEKVVHATADALLLAEYCRRIKTGEL